MLADVGKFLRYAGGPSASDPGWDWLTDRDQLVEFLQVILLKDSPEMFEKARHTLLLGGRLHSEATRGS